ncbi:MAG: hypothetical protein PWP65_122 [Clostridia bacterium]|nr:hypothetical protein [Clostridia bacterium]
MPLGRHLRLLSGFGLLHGIAEWAYIFLSPGLETGGWQTLRGSVLGGGHAFLISISFAFLFSFGSSLSGNRPAVNKWLPYLPWAALSFWIYLLFSLFARSTGNPQAWLTYAEIWSRYVLAFPGALLSSWGLWVQREEVRKLNDVKIERNLIGGTLVFLLYAFAGGLVVPPAKFFPANIIKGFMKIGQPD